MIRLRFTIWVLGVLALGILGAQRGYGGMSGGIPFQPVSPDELKMTADPLAPGAQAIILYRQVDRTDDVHTPHEDNYVRIKILTEKGRDLANVEIPFLNTSENIVSIRARTIRPDGSTVEFGGKVFDKDLEKGKLQGSTYKYRARTFTLPDVQVGSIIEYAFTRDLREYMIFDSRWIISSDLFTRKAEFSLKPFHDSYYGNFNLRWNWNTLPTGTDPPKQGPDGIVRMTATNIPAFQEEEYMPPPEELKSRVDFIYEEGFADKDAASYWKRIGKQRNGQLESFVGKHRAMEEAVATIVSPSDPPEAKLRKIYDRVQQLRNTSYEVQKTEQEKKRAKEKADDHVNVEDVWKRGYGDGVTLTWLFLGLTRAAGFDSYGCWVASRQKYFFSPKTMEGDKLSANVVLVKLNGKDLYFDPGAAFTPYGLLQWQETNVTGLRLDKDGGTWIQTMLPMPSDSRIERTGKLKLTDTGDLQGNLKVARTGLAGMYHRVEERLADEVERKKYLEDLLSSEIGVASEVELTNKPDWTGSETPLVAEYKLKIPGWVSSAGRRAVMPAAIFTVAEKGMFEHANRVQPIYFSYPFEKVDDVTVELPAGWQVSSVPAAQDNNGNVVRYSLKVDSSAGTVRLTRKLSVDALLIEQKYYTALRNFFQAVRTGDGEQIVLQPGEIHASN